MITQNESEIKLLKESGRILAATLELVRQQVKPGTVTADLDRLAEENILRLGGFPSFKNYRSYKSDPAYPASLCVSINDEVVHGIPSKEKILKDGDIVGLDLGVNFQGYYTDAAITVPVGRVAPKYLKLLETTQLALESALSLVRPGNTTGDLGNAMDSIARKHGFAVVRELVGHGVGKSVHEDPEIPCYGKPGTGTKLRQGMVLAIEPMINEYSWEVAFAKDKWTVLTLDGGRSAHFEHTVLVTKDGLEVLTQI